MPINNAHRYEVFWIRIIGTKPDLQQTAVKKTDRMVDYDNPYFICKEKLFYSTADFNLDIFNNLVGNPKNTI